MNAKNNFDELIKLYYNDAAEKINCNPGMLQKIEERIENGENNKSVSSGYLQNITLLFRLNGRKAVFTVLFIVMIMSFSTFAFSKSIRVMAVESLSKVTSYIYTIVYTGSGYKAVKTSEEPIKESALRKKYTYHETILPDSELSKIAGFKVRLPSCPEGYVLRDKAWIRYEDDKSKDTSVLAFYIKNESSEMTSQSYLFMQTGLKSPYVGELYKLKPVKIGEMEGYWGETPFGIWPNDDPHNMPKEIKVYHTLYWIDNGVYNIIFAGESPQETTIDLAKAIINAEDTAYKIPDSYKNYSNWTPFMYSPEKYSEINMEGRVSFPYKIPQKLAEGYTLKEKGFVCKLPENFQSKFTEELWNLIGASYVDGTGGDQVNLVISDRDSVVNDWKSAEKVSIGNIEAYWGKQTKQDITGTLIYDLYRTASVNTNSHFIAWRKGEVFYKIYMEKGDFRSRETAVKLAESVIND